MNEKDSIPNLGGIPRGLEVLLKKASVDPAFRELLLARRIEAARSIGLALTPSELLILQSAPTDQLEAMIGQTRVPQEHRRVFLGQAAAAMLTSLGIMTLPSGCGPAGCTPNFPSRRQQETSPDKKDLPDRPPDEQPK